MRLAPPGMVIASPPSDSASRMRIGDAVALLGRQPEGAPRLDVERGEGRMQAVGEALGIADEARGARILADADEDTLAGSPRARNGVRLHVRQQLVVDPLGRGAEGELAERGEVARREVVLERPLRLLGQVDLAFLQPLDQIVRRQVDELDGVGAVENRVGHRLAHPDPRDLGDDVVEALDVLDVERGVDVDAVGEQLLDVEVALRVAAAGRVGVGELVDQRDLGPAGEEPVEVHFLERVALVLDALARQDVRPSSSASVSLRPWVSTTPTTMSTPSRSLARADCSIS